MHDKAIPQPDRGCNPPSIESQDAAVQRAILGSVLDALPHKLTIPELAREINQSDAVERAVRDLVGVGLLECSGISIKPSAAALRFYRLDLP